MAKKLLLLAAATGALVAFAAPASAMAEPFTHEGGPVPVGGVTVEYTGWAEIATANGGLKCEDVTTTVTFTTEDAHVTSFTGEACQTTGLLGAIGCKVEGEHAFSTELPWTIDPNQPNPGELEITNINIDNVIEPCAAFPSGIIINLTGNVQLQQASGLDVITLSGTIATNVGSAAVHGELTSMSPGTVTLMD